MGEPAYFVWAKRSRIFENCLAAEARDGKLYLIEKDSEKTCVLTVRS